MATLTIAKPAYATEMKVKSSSTVQPGFLARMVKIFRLPVILPQKGGWYI